MDIGVVLFPTDTTMQPIELGRVCEERGFESLWFPEHSHIPVSRATPWGGRVGAPPLPEYYWRTHDQFVALAAIAATTERIRLGTGICLVAQRDPLWLAKQVASLDQISGGRFLFGVGYGWNKEELAHHGVHYADRRDRLRESVLAMKALWQEDEASFDGGHVSFSPSWAWPKPSQQPHPPVILGGDAGPRTAAHIAEFCDGWMPIGGRHGLDSGLAEIRKACEERGRDPESLHIGVFGAKPDRATIDDLAERGVQRVALTLPQGDRSEVLAALDRYTELV